MFAALKRSKLREAPAVLPEERSRCSFEGFKYALTSPLHIQDANCGVTTELV